MKKKKSVVLLSIFFIILLAVVCVLLWQRNNVTAIVQATSNTPQEIEAKLLENDTAIQTAIEEVPDLTLRPVTEEERAKLQSGEISSEELIKQIQVPAAPSAHSTEPEPPVQSPYSQKLSAIIAEVFVLREEYAIELDKIETEAKREYFAIPKSERTSNNLTSLGSKYITIASSLEKKCDNQMDEIIDRLRSLIDEYNGDKKIISQIQYNYAQGKSLKKAWYLSKLKEKGIE